MTFYSYVGINSTAYFTNNSGYLDRWSQNSNQVHYPRNVQAINGETHMQFARTPNAAAINMSRSTHTGAIVLMDPNPYANTLYFQDHGLSTGDVIYLQSTSSSTPGGISRNFYHNVYRIDKDRFQLSRYNSNSIVNITSQGSASATISYTGWSAVDGADFIDATQVITPAATPIVTGKQV